MVVINDVNSQKFTFNGIEYFKNFTPVVIGDKVRILNAYDSAIELTSNPTLFSDFVVDGNNFLTVSALQTALLPVLYTRSTLGADTVIEGYFNGTDFYTDALFTNLITPESGKIYIELDTNLQYRWSGSAYVQIRGIQGVFLGSVTPTDIPTGTGEAFWIATENGTYTNFGGLVVDLNSFAFISRDASGNFSISQTALDLTDYIQKNQEFPTWTATTFISGSKVSYLGKFWKSNASTVGTDVPGTSSKWVELLSGYEEKTPVTDFIKSLVTYTPNLYNSENIQYNKYIDPADGIIKTITNGIISGFISVDVLKKYTVKSDISLGLINFKTIGFYDVNFAVVGYSSRNTITGLPENVNCNVTYNDFLWDTGVLPTGTKYVVFTLRGNDTTTAWSTANVTMREFDYSSDINSEIVTDVKMESAINAAVAPYLKDSELAKDITLSQTYEEGSLFNVAGVGIGNILASATWLRTGLTPVTALDTMFVKGVLGGGNFYIVFYNSDTPSNASYVANIRPNFVASATKVYEFIVPIGATHVGFNIGRNTTYNFAQLKASFVFSTNQSFYSTKEIVGYSVRKNNLLNLSSLVWNSGGDSITWQDEKNFTTGLDAGNLAIGYQTLVRRKIQFRKHNNCGISGFALSASTPDDGKSWIKAYNTFPVADVFTLAHGTNDYRLNRPLGTQADYDNNTGNLTFYGSLRIFIDSCYLANPLYKIILITPLQRNADGYTGWSANLLGHTLNDYADAIRYVGFKESLPVIDLLKTSGINLKNISQYTSDGLHPHNLGYEVMAIPIIAEMEKINF